LECAVPDYTSASDESRGGLAIIDYQKLINHPPKEEEITYTERDTMLYALGVGLGFDPIDPRQLPFIYERDLLALPTIAMAIGHPGWWLGAAGLIPEQTVHAEKRMEVLAPMPTAGTVVTKSSVTGATDKGRGRGALIHTERNMWDKKTGKHLSRQINTMMSRGQGGFGGPTEMPRQPHRVPDRLSDAEVDLPTMPQQALIFRLSGDRHMLHVDPEAARRGGFTRPILHGLANMAIATHAVLRSECNYDVSKIKAVQCRFTSPVFPGDTITTKIWRDGSHLSFRAAAKERGLVVVDNGLVEIAAP
jgi:acyl dehydratase